MNMQNKRLAALTVLLAVFSLPVAASSTATSSAADGISASVGSISDSIRGSSNSSANAVTAGDYKVIEIAAVAERPGFMRLTLQPMADHAGTDSILLEVPRQALKQNPVAVGQVVSARDRPYGTEFALKDTGKAFFLALQDNWYRELQASVVAL